MRKEYPESKVNVLNYKEKLWTSTEGANEEAGMLLWDVGRSEPTVAVFSVCVM
jgi:hypothetical protein